MTVKNGMTEQIMREKKKGNSPSSGGNSPGTGQLRGEFEEKHWMLSSGAGRKARWSKLD